MHAADRPDAAWWRQAVIYQIYPRSWADADGDGIGDLPGITSRLPHLRDARRRRHLALARSTPRRRTTPATTSPTTATSTRSSAPSPTPTRCSRRAHELGLRVIVDLVPNHSSDEHAWFQAALAAGAGLRRARALHVPRRQGRRRRAAAEQLGVRLRRPRLDARHRGRRHARASGTCTSSTPTQPDFDWEQPGGARPSSSRSCASGSTAASTASASTSPTA